MQNTPFNPDIYKENQRKDWNTVSSGWEKWWDVIEKGAASVSDSMLDMADIKPGHHVLDVATGIGEPALNAARRVGKRGHVVAVDQATDMLAIARRRAQALGLENVTFQQMDGEILATTENNFDTVLCRWGLMFMPNFEAALRRMYSLTKPGGKIATAVWSTPERVPSISLGLGVVKEILQPPPPPPGTPNPFCLADTTQLEHEFHKAGFKDIRIETIMVDFAMPSAQVYVEFTKDINAPLMALLANQPAAKQELVWDAMAEAVGRYATPDGSIRIVNEAICFAGRR